MKIAIIDYGAGNIQSIQFALERLGFEGILTNDVAFIQSADKVIFPGVGEASSAMKKLKASRLAEIIPNLTQPVLGIFDVNVQRFSNAVKVPQMGWNTINNLNSDLFKNTKENEYMYLVHSYYASKCAEMIASTNYEFEYASALQKNNFYGVQFHPEKSGSAGEQILKNFLTL